MKSKLAVIALAALAGLLLPLPVTARAAQPQSPISVMTRNLDLGSDYGYVLTATDAASFAHGVTTTYDEIVASNIPERAAGVAAEIARSTPDVVSLQEVSLVQRLVPSPTGLVVTDQLDQLASLESSLAALGSYYKLAVSVPEFDVTVPSDAGFYARVRDGEAILVRSDLPTRVLTVANPQSGHFSSLLPLPTPAGTITALRGWASVDVTHLGVTTRVIDTHLEALYPPVAAAQAGELLTGPANTNSPVVVAGDLNSGPGTYTGAYNALMAMMTDTWVATKAPLAGLTCCLYPEDDAPYPGGPDKRIDLVLSRGLVPITDVLVGTTGLTGSGLYPSDHAGVVARLAPAS